MCICLIVFVGGACGVGTWKQRWNAKWNSNEIQMQVCVSDSVCVWILLIYFINSFLMNLFQKLLWP